MKSERSFTALDKSIAAGSGWESTANAIMGSAEQWIATNCEDFVNPGLSVDLGFMSDTDLLTSHRLQNYATLIADRVKKLMGLQFNSVRVTKQLGAKTSIAIGEAPKWKPPIDSVTVAMTTRRSYATPAFSGEVRANSAPLAEILRPNTPLRVQASYVSGLPRTWSRLWRPTVEAILEARPQRNNARSTQVVELSFHHTSIGEELGHDVKLEISASTVESFIRSR